MASDNREDLGLGLKPGDPHYRAYVGPPEDYDLIAAMTFNLLTTLGLRQDHSLLSSIDHVVDLIAKMNRPPTMSHGSRIWIGGANSLI